MLIGELAERTRTTTRALRYYEEQRLLTSARTTTGYRVYPPEAVARVRNIRELLASGFTVDNVRAFLPHLDDDVPEVFTYAPVCDEAYEVGAQRVADLNERIGTLTGLRDRLVSRMPWLAEA
jgi:DNA-binding transcriptional MerR regulator